MSEWRFISLPTIGSYLGWHFKTRKVGDYYFYSTLLRDQKMAHSD